MQNNNSKLNTSLLIVIIILLIVGIWMLVEKIERESRIKGEPQVVDDINEEQSQEEQKSDVTQQKPAVTTLSFVQKGGSSCMPDPNCTGPTTPSEIILSGSYNGHESTTTTWFEYWTTNWATGEEEFSTTPVVQLKYSGSVSENVAISPTPTKFRFVAQNSAGITYGETKNIFIAMP
jgi:hypothetical protein